MKHGRPLTNEEVLDCVTNRLITGPAATFELYAACDFRCTQDQIDQAIWTLDEVKALTSYRESRRVGEKSERVYIYALRSEARTWMKCPICKGIGVRTKQKTRCGNCKGDGLVTPRVPVSIH